MKLLAAEHASSSAASTAAKQYSLRMTRLAEAMHTVSSCPWAPLATQPRAVMQQPAATVQKQLAAGHDSSLEEAGTCSVSSAHLKILDEVAGIPPGCKGRIHALGGEVVQLLEVGVHHNFFLVGVLEGLDAGEGAVLACSSLGGVPAKEREVPRLDMAHSAAQACSCHVGRCGAGRFAGGSPHSNCEVWAS